jgi:hypothetical protein
MSTCRSSPPVGRAVRLLLWRWCSSWSGPPGSGGDPSPVPPVVLVRCGAVFEIGVLVGCEEAVAA